ALDGDALLGRQRVRPLLQRRRTQRPAAPGKQATARLLQPLLQLAPFGAQRVGRAQHARRAHELLLTLGALAGRSLASFPQRHDAVQVDETDSREGEDAKDDALVTT